MKDLNKSIFVFYQNIAAIITSINLKNFFIENASVILNEKNESDLIGLVLKHLNALLLLNLSFSFSDKSALISLYQVDKLHKELISGFSATESFLLPTNFYKFTITPFVKTDSDIIHRRLISKGYSLAFSKIGETIVFAEGNYQVIKDLSETYKGAFSTKRSFIDLSE